MGRGRAERAWWRLRRDWALWAVLAGYAAGNVALFAFKFEAYRRHREHAFAVMGYCVCVARGCAMALKFNVALALALMCRTLLAPVGEKRVFFHKVVGSVCVVLAVVHSAAHVCDFSQLDGASLEELRRLWPMSTFTAESKPTSRDLWLSLPGITGIAMLACFAVSYGCILLRHRFFQAFVLSHQLLVVMPVLLLFHGQLGLLEPAQAPYWVVPPLLAYLADRALRLARTTSRVGPGSDRSLVEDARLLGWNQDVVELTLAKPVGFCFKPGAFVLVRVPAVSRMEWHPFSIASAPEDPHIVLFVKGLGDWTASVLALFKEAIEQNTISAKISSSLHAEEALWPLVDLGPPEGAPAQQWSGYDVVTFVSTGVGVTPHLSILRHLVHRYRSEQARGEGTEGPPDLPARVYFVWVVKDVDELAWASEALAELASLDSGSGILSTHCYVTGDCGDDRARLVESEGLESVRFGKPEWAELFTDIRVSCTSAMECAGQRSCVFATVPPALDRELERVTLALSDSNVAFDYKSESCW